MALRPELCGFDLSVLDSLLGSKSAETLKSVISEFDEKVSFDDPNTTEIAHEILRRAIYDGHRWADLEVEGEAHVMAAITLASHNQKHVETGSNFWNMQAFFHFIQNCREELPIESRRLLNVFGVGRALFGKRIETPWSFYGYLSHKHICTLRQGLLDLQEKDAKYVGTGFMGGFVDEFIGWLSIIVEAKKDLWFYAY